jgi:HEPN domain-containing protein
MVLTHSDEIINRWVRQAEHDLENAKKNLDIDAYDVSDVVPYENVDKEDAEDGINKAEQILELIKYHSIGGN